MEPSLDQVIPLAMQLSNSNRAALAEQLLESLDGEPEFDEQEHHTLWELEADKRSQEVLSGKVKPIPYGKAMDDLRKKHGCRNGSF